MPFFLAVIIIKVAFEFRISLKLPTVHTKQSRLRVSFPSLAPKKKPNPTKNQTKQTISNIAYTLNAKIGMLFLSSSHQQYTIYSHNGHFRPLFSQYVFTLSLSEGWLFNLFTLTCLRGRLHCSRQRTWYQT